MQRLKQNPSHTTRVPNKWMSVMENEILTCDVIDGKQKVVCRFLFWCVGTFADLLELVGLALSSLNFPSICLAMNLKFFPMFTSDRMMKTYRLARLSLTPCLITDCWVETSPSAVKSPNSPRNYASGFLLTPVCLYSSFSIMLNQIPDIFILFTGNCFQCNSAFSVLKKRVQPLIYIKFFILICDIRSPLFIDSFCVMLSSFQRNCSNCGVSLCSRCCSYKVFKSTMGATGENFTWMF